MSKVAVILAVVDPEVWDSDMTGNTFHVNVPGCRPPGPTPWRYGEPPGQYRNWIAIFCNCILCLPASQFREVEVATARPRASGFHHDLKGA